jgi:hypothetical protein
MKQTAVQWLVEQIFNDVDLKDSILKLAIQQAKEMEKKQIKNSYNIGYHNNYIGSIMDSEEYYQITYEAQETN